MLGFCITLLLFVMTSTGAAQSTPIDRFVWQSPDPAIGGMSAIEIAADGRSFVALSDRASFATGTIIRDEMGRIKEITDLRTAPVQVVETGQRGTTPRDSEGLAIGADGTIFVSFESEHRVAAFANIDAVETTLPTHPDFALLQSNSSLEGLAIDAAGNLYTMPERSGRYDKPFPIYRFRDGRWDIPYVLPRVGSFLLVGADFGPDGLLYVLERDFTGFSFLNRVRQVDLDAGTSKTVVSGRGQFGNLEGISVWRNSHDQLVVTMIADNNNSFLLQTEIIEFRIDG